MAEQGESMGGERPQISGGQERAEREFRPTFLVENEEELKRLEDDPKTEGLGRRIRRMNEGVLLGIYGPEELRQEYIKLDEKVNEKVFGGEDVDPFRIRISKEVRRLSEERGEREERAARVLEGKRLVGIEKLNKEGQREMARVILEEIESNDYSLGHPLNAVNAAQLERTMGLVNPEVASEIRARLRLQECYSLVRRVGGKPEDIILGLRDAAQELVARGHLLDGQDFNVLIREGLPDLRIGDALDQLQTWAVKGFEPEELTFFDKKLTPVSKREIEGKIAEGLGGGRNGQKSLQLATRFAYVTFETSVWNKAALPGDALAGAIYFRTDREDNFQRGKDKGPSITIPVIPGFGTSFFRWATREVPAENGKTKKERLFNQEKWAEVKRKRATTDVTGDIRKLTSLDKGEDDKRIDKDRLLKFKEGEYGTLPVDSYGTYLSAYLPGILTAKDLLLKSDWKPDDFSRDQTMTWVGVFDTHADPDRDLSLKTYFITGALDEGLLQPDRLGWGQVEYKQAERNLTAPLGSREGKDIVFITKGQMEWVNKTIGSGRRAFTNDISMGFRGVTRVRR